MSRARRPGGRGHALVSSHWTALVIAAAFWVPSTADSQPASSVPASSIAPVSGSAPVTATTPGAAPATAPTVAAEAMVAAEATPVATAAEGAGATVTTAALATARSTFPGGLAARVPADTRVYLEVRGLGRLLDSRAGGLLARVLSMATADGPQAGPASQPGWQTLLARSVGLGEDMSAGRLFSGDLALAADSWSGIGDAILLVLPARPEALAAELEDWPAQGGGGTLRRYGLREGQELATDGVAAVIGRKSSRQGLYARATALWEGTAGESLGDKPSFRERTSGLPADVTALLYIEGTESVSAGELISRRWPADWIRLAGVAIGLRATAEAVDVDVNCRLQDALPPTSRGFRGEPFLSLPATTIAAFNWPGDPIGAHRRTLGDPGGGMLRALLETLEAGLAPQDVESELLGQFLDDPVVVLDELALPAGGGGAGSGGGPQLTPGLTMVARVRDPGVVEGFMRRMLQHLAERLDAAGGSAAVVRVQPVLGEAQGLIRSVPVAGLLTGAAPRDLLEPLELSYTVHGRRLVVGTHPQAVRQLVLAAVGRLPTMPAEVVRASLARAAAGGTCRMLAVCRPWMLAQVVDAQLACMAATHPELFEAGWWRRVRARREASREQLGVRGRSADRAVEVVQVLPDGAAAGRLQPKDRILAVDGISLDPARPTDSLRELLAMREHPDLIRLLVLREGGRTTVEVPMPSAGDQEVANPLQQLRSASRLLRQVRWAGWVSWQSSQRELGIHCRLVLAAGSGVQPQPQTDRSE